MALSLTDALSRFGFWGDLANSVPGLKAIFSKAASEEWDPLRFQQAVQDSAWWKSNSDSARALAVQYATDPATYRQSIKNAADKVYLLQRELGYAPASQRQRESIAKHFIVNNYDDDQIRRWLALNSEVAVGAEGYITGQAADLQEQMRKTATDYGVPITEQYLRTYLQRIQAGDYTLTGFDALMRARAKATYPQFSEQIDSGLTVRDIADPYISTMANTLEIGQTEIELSDPNIKRALSQKQPDGTVGSTPLWEFERQLKDDPRWDKTKQARTQAFEVASQIGKDWGFVA